MTVLVALSILAFVALLWATFSIAGFVRRARRRQRRRTAGLEVSGSSQRSLPAEPLLYVDPEAAVAPVPEAAPALATTSSLKTQDPPPPPALPHRAQPAEQVVAANAAPVATVEPPPMPERAPEPPPRLRSFPTRLGKHTAPEATPEVSGKWNPFSKDLADLSDPAPTWRNMAARTRTREKR